MVKVTIGNSLSKIEGMDKGQESSAREILSYQIDSNASYFSGAYKRYRRYLIDTKGQFPTGLLHLVKKLFPDATYQDLRMRPTKAINRFCMVLGVSPFPEQIEASQACLRRSRGVITASTGVGKSIIAALIVDVFQVRTLIVVPNLGLKEQLRNSFREWFGNEAVGGVGSDIAIENVDALDPNIPLIGYDCVIIDEFHHSAAKTYRKLNLKSWQGVYYRFGLSATPWRTQDEEKILLESILSEVIYKIEYKDAVDQKYIVPVEAYWYELPKIAVKGYSWAEVYSELVVGRRDRNELIAGILQRLRALYIPTLCLVKEIKHGENIQELVPHIPFIKGENDDNAHQLREFNNGKQVSLIGTTGVLGEGIDTKPAEYVIIAGLGKSPTQLMQQIGRGLRKYGNKESCKVILFLDRSHKFTIRHFNAQKKILLDQYGIKPIKLKL